MYGCLFIFSIYQGANIDMKLWMVTFLPLPIVWVFAWVVSPFVRARTIADYQTWESYGVVFPNWWMDWINSPVSYYAIWGSLLLSFVWVVRIWTLYNAK